MRGRGGVEGGGGGHFFCIFFAFVFHFLAFFCICFAFFLYYSRGGDHFSKFATGILVPVCPPPPRLEPPSPSPCPPPSPLRPPTPRRGPVTNVSNSPPPPSHSTEFCIEWERRRAFSGVYSLPGLGPQRAPHSAELSL